MKSKSLEQSIREAAAHERSLSLNPGDRTYRTWPMCMTCNQEVSAAEIVNINTKSCEIRAICDHGTGIDHEDFYKVYWQVPVADVGVDTLDDVNVGWAMKRAVSDGRFFDPKHSFDFSSKRN